MSDETEKPKLDELLLPELQEQWPNSEDGRLCSRLLQRYCYTILIKTALSADCGPMTAPAEAGAHKAIAKMAIDFGGLASPQPKREAPRKMQPLHRFQSETPQ